MVYYDSLKCYQETLLQPHEVRSTWSNVLVSFQITIYLGKHSLVPSLHAPPSEKWSDEQCQISWAYYTKDVKTNEIARSVVAT